MRGLNPVKSVSLIWLEPNYKKFTKPNRSIPWLLNGYYWLACKIMSTSRSLHVKYTFRDV